MDHQSGVAIRNPNLLPGLVRETPQYSWLHHKPRWNCKLCAHYDNSLAGCNSAPQELDQPYKCPLPNLLLFLLLCITGEWESLPQWGDWSGHYRMVGKCGITLWQDDQQATWEPLHVCAAAKIEELSRLLGSVDRTLLLLHLGNCWQDHRQTTSGSSRKQITVQPWSRLVEPLLHTVTNLSNLTQTHSNLPEFFTSHLETQSVRNSLQSKNYWHTFCSPSQTQGRCQKNLFWGKVLHYWWAPPPFNTLSYHAGLVSWLQIGVRSAFELYLQTPYRDFFIPSWHWRRSPGCLPSWSWWSY